MASRRDLTREERRAAERFRALMLASDKTQEQIADEIGVTQGAVWQWADGKVPISAKRAAAVGRAVGVHPSEISVAWKESQVSPEHITAKAAPRHASQAVRLDPGMLSQTHKFLETAFALQGKNFDLQSNWDLFSDAYEYFIEDDRPMDDRNLVDFGRWLAARQAKQEQPDEQDEGVAGQARKKNSRRA